MGKDSLSNLVTAWVCTVPKSISYSNKDQRGRKHEQSRKLNEELHMGSTVTVVSESLNGLQIDLRLRTGYLNYLEANVDVYVCYCLQDTVHDKEFENTIHVGANLNKTSFHTLFVEGINDFHINLVFA